MNNYTNAYAPFEGPEKYEMVNHKPEMIKPKSRRNISHFIINGDVNSSN